MLKYFCFSFHLEYEAKHDVFICYSSKDRNWAMEELLTELEGRRSFSCFIDFRDFIPGMKITENIYQAIDRSRNTVLILSPDFVDSNWCIFDLEISLIRKPANQVVPIVYRECKIPECLEGVNCLHWEKFPQKTHFWDALERDLSLPDYQTKGKGRTRKE